MENIIVQNILRMRKPKQISLFKEPRRNTKLWWIVKQHTYGGALNYRKTKRPFDSKKLVHVVFKAQLGNGIWFTRSRKPIGELLAKVANRYGVKIKDTAINRDHIHLLISCAKPELLCRFLRLFAAEMGRKYKAIYARYGLTKPNNLWKARPFTRLVSWGKKSLTIARNYLQRNRDEVLGFIEYRPRKHRLNQFLARWEEQWALDTA